MREGTGISLRELSRRTGINSGRLSIIERGVAPTLAERASLLRELGKLLAGPAADLGLPLEPLTRGEPA
jgi:transcriptional regulator with XRE-family HTH domain